MRALLFGVSGALEATILQNSLFFSLLAGNLVVETGSTATASATTQFPESLITETLREQAALARPVRHVIFDIWSPAGEAGRNLGLVSGQKNSGPGATCLETGNLMGPGQVSRIGGTIQRGNRARPLLKCREVASHRLRPVRAWVR